MVKVAFIKEKQVAPKNNGLSQLFAPYLSYLSLELLPLSGIMPGQRGIDFWQGEGGPSAALSNGRLAKGFARKMAKRQVAVCGGEGWSYPLEQQMQRHNEKTIFTGGFSLSLFTVFDFLLQRAQLWRNKDVVILDADNQLGRFTALCLGTEARLLLLTGKDKAALELLSDEIFSKTGLAARIVSEEKALGCGEIFFLAGAEKKISFPGVLWDLAAISGLRAYSRGGKIESRFLYPAYHRTQYLPAGWLAATLLAQWGAAATGTWKTKTASEKVFFWLQNKEQQQYAGISPIFLLQRENGTKFYQLFGRENLC